MNQLAQYLGHKLFHSTIIVWTHTHTVVWLLYLDHQSSRYKWVITDCIPVPVVVVHNPLPSMFKHCLHYLNEVTMPPKSWGRNSRFTYAPNKQIGYIYGALKGHGEAMFTALQVTTATHPTVIFMCILLFFFFLLCPQNTEPLCLIYPTKNLF